MPLASEEVDHGGVARASGRRAAETICSQEGGVERRKWVCTVEDKGHCAGTSTFQGHGRNPRGASGNWENEEFCSGICLVAEYRQESRGLGPKMRFVPVSAEVTSQGSNTTLGVARKTMDTVTYRPCGKMVLILVDAHSKWVEAQVVSSTSAAAAIDKLRMIFATHGLPNTIVSDNGPAFVSAEFKEFLQCNGIEQVLSPPYHLSSNGLAERAVQTVKQGVKKMVGPLETRLSRFLFKYRVTPPATTSIAPAELLMGRRLRTHLDLLYPSVKDRVRKNQRSSVGRRGGSVKKTPYVPGDRVRCRNFGMGLTWLTGVVIEVDGTSVRVRLEDGRLWRRHLDHVVPHHEPDHSTALTPSEPVSQPADDDPLTSPEDTSTNRPEPTDANTPTLEQANEPVAEERDHEPPTVELRRSTRSSRPPDHLM